MKVDYYSLCLTSFIYCYVCEIYPCSYVLCNVYSTGPLHNLLIHSHIDRHLDNFQFGAIMNSTTMNMTVSF